MKRVIKKINRQHVREIFVYGLVGGSAWIVQSLIFLLCINFKLLPSVSMALGNVSGFIVAYFGHIRFTFRKEHRFSHSEFIKLWVTSGIGLIINLLGVHLIIKVFALDPHYGIIPTILTPGVTFLISKFWVFK